LSELSRSSPKLPTYKGNYYNEAFSELICTGIVIGTGNTECPFHGLPEHGIRHGICQSMQAFRAIKLPFSGAQYMGHPVAH
jgi:hypothetical protein